MTAPRLDRLIAADRLDELLAAAAAVAPRFDVQILDPSGGVIAATARHLVGVGTGSKPPATIEPPPTDAATRPLLVDGIALGSVAVRAVPVRDATAGGPDHAVDSTGEAVASLDETAARSLADLVGRAVELAAAEGLGRRAVTAAAIDDLRELALLSRLSETIGSAVDPAGIAVCVLDTVSRPLGPSVGLVVGPDDETLLATSGTDEDLADLLGHAPPLIARLRAEDPTIGSCAAIQNPTGERLGTILTAFLRTARGHHGTIILGRPAGAPSFTAADRQLLASVAGQAAIAIERAALQRQVVERRALDQELAIGRRIQISLMPRRFPRIDGWEIASAYEPAREVGGDFYDVFHVRDRPGCIGLVVADVTGKGIPAAILMADTRGLIHAAADHSNDPVDTLNRVNRILVDERASGLFVTVAHAILDAQTGRLVFARAGHDPVHVLRAGGRLEVLAPPGRLIGMVAELDLTAIELTLEPGDAFIGHTDGVTEARSADGSFYGEDRYRALLAGHRGATAAAIVEAVVADVASFRGRAEPSDDLTLLVVRREPVSAG